MTRLFSVNLGGGGGQGITVYNTVLDLPVAGADGVPVSVLSTRKLYAWNAVKGKWVVIGGEGAFIGRVNQTAIPNATQTLAVTFSEVMPSTEYSLFATIRNTTDTDPIWLQIVQTVRSVSGFTVVFNAPTDSSNYVLEWGVSSDSPEEV